LLGPGGGIKRDTWEQSFRILLRETEGDHTGDLVQSSPSITMKSNLGPDATYRAGDEVVVSIAAPAGYFVGLFRIDSRGELHQLYPTSKGPQARVSVNPIRVVDFPGRTNRVFGVETLIGVASAQPIPLEHQSGWDSFRGLLRTWSASNSPPRRDGVQEIAVLRFFTAP
jgi:hypothetical protein